MSQGIWFGTAYYGDHWPENEWDQDFARMRAAGLQWVRFGEFSWSWFEPRDGEFDFGPYDRFVAAAARHGLQVILCTPTATPPPWFVRKYPDGRVQDENGNGCHAPRHFWCWNHKASRAQAERTIRALVSRYATHPAVWGWQIDNEPNLSEKMSPLYDFNPATMDEFRAWLKKKYGSLDALNAAWYANFWSQRNGSWEDVGVLLPHTSNPNANLDFRRFRAANVASFVHWQRDLIRALAPKQKVGTNIPEIGVVGSTAIAQDYRAQAEGLDWAATDLYYASADRAKDMEALAYSTDLLRCAVKDALYGITETQGGPHQRCWPQGFAGEAWGPDYLKQSVECYARHGAKLVGYFLWRPTPGGTELGMNGVQDFDGSDTVRTALVKELAAEQERLTALHTAWSQRPEAFIHYSPDTFYFLSYWNGSLDAIDRSMKGTHALLQDAGFRVTFLFDEDLAKTQPRSGAWLILPHTHVVNAETKAAVERWTAGGGRVLAGPHTGLLDGRGQIVGGGVLRELFGARLSYWHDIKINAKFTGTDESVPAVKGYRVLDGAPPSWTLSLDAKSAPAAWVQRAGATLSAADFGLLYFEANATGRAWLREHLLPTPA